MTERLARRLARIGGWTVAFCVLVLVVDWAVFAIQTPRNDKLVADLQKQVKTNAALAPKLADEQKRITSARIWRKRRDHWAGYLLIAAAAVFLTSSKRIIARAAGTRGARPPSVVYRKSPDRLLTRAAPKPAAAPPPLDLAFVDQLVAKHGRGKEAAIPLLQAIQEHYRYLPDAALARLCELTEITPAQIAGTSTFYGQFRRSPVGKHIVKVCHGTACHVAGARQVTDELRRYLAIPDGADTDAARMFTLEEVACLGCCSLAPVLMVDTETAGRLTLSTACDALDAVERKEPA